MKTTIFLITTLFLTVFSSASQAKEIKESFFKGYVSIHYIDDTNKPELKTKEQINHYLKEKQKRHYERRLLITPTTEKEIVFHQKELKSIITDKNGEKAIIKENPYIKLVSSAVEKKSDGSYQLDFTFNDTYKKEHAKDEINIPFSISYNGSSNYEKYPYIDVQPSNNSYSVIIVEINIDQFNF